MSVTPSGTVLTGALALAALLASCSRSPSTPSVDGLEIVAAGGDAQHGTAGVQLPEALRVVVREVATTRPVEDIRVRWTVEAGDAEIVGPDVAVTDVAGVATSSIRLGTTEGEIRVTASLVSDAARSASFRVFLVGTPVLESLTPDEAAAGERVVLTGENFSTVAEQNVVLFSGIRARVLEAAPDRLEVEVPSCLGARPVDVEARLGAVASEHLPFVVTEGGAVTELEVGEALDLTDEDGLGCVRLPGGAGVRYLAVTHTTSAVGAAAFGYELHGLAVPGGILAEAGPRPVDTGAPPASAPAPYAPRHASGSLQDELDRRLRALERTLAPAPGGLVLPERGPAGAPGAPPPVPVVGEQRDFFVYNGGEGTGAQAFDSVHATARYVGERVALFVDDDAPAEGFAHADLEAFAARFDEVIQPVVTETYGEPSDLDGNEVVVVLFTPVVNRMTPEDATSFVGGFFYGRDLLPQLDYSNAAEVFYALVPDPEGIHSGPRSVELVLGSVPAILAHEFQHMVHFNARVLTQPGGVQDALWMLEALAQMAEESVARYYLEVDSDTASAGLFRDGNRRRARLYLQSPDTISLVAASGRGTLGERGAGLLFLLYLDALEGGDLLWRLTNTQRSGVANIEAEVGRSWEDLVSDWWEATYRDEDGAGPDRRSYPGFDLPAFLGEPPPLAPPELGGVDFQAAGSLPSSAARYHLLRPPSGGSLSVRLGGPAGGPHATGAGMRLRIVRVP